MAKVVEMKEVSFAYERRLILDRIELAVEAGDFFGVIGPNGGGKTTLLRLILGSLEPVRGTVRLFAHPPQKTSRLVGYVPQSGNFKKDFPVSVLEVVLMGRMLPGKLFPCYSAADHSAAQAALEAVGLQELAKAKFGELSGGQKQRTLIARALVADPQLLILDEPTANLDHRAEQEIYTLLKALNQKVTIIAVSHDLGFVSSYVNKVAYLNRNLVLHPPGKISPASVAELYQRVAEGAEQRVTSDESGVVKR
ncbi:MAG: ABC transporter ATP-binding protein [Firmicutes bacterium]|nr:ABC transporter ATP-binding protein [Bacillota bacterium]